MPFLVSGIRLAGYRISGSSVKKIADIVSLGNYFFIKKNEKIERKKMIIGRKKRRKIEKKNLRLFH